MVEIQADGPQEQQPVAGAKLSIDQVAALAGVTTRTVRYYLQEGLISRPEGAKRGAYYLQKHVEELLLLRRWADAGLSLDRIRELRAGAADEPPPRAVRAGSVEVWSRVTLADGLEVQIEPGRAGLTPEQVRAFVRDVTAAYRKVRGGSPQEDEAQQ
jgi:DNA-binding transcriptional MerR regulator